MKLLLGMVALILLILGSSVYAMYWSSALTRDLERALTGIEQCVNTEDWEGAAQHVKALDRGWTRADALWSPLMDHHEVETVGHTVARLAREVESRRAEETLAEISVARVMIRNIHQMHRPGLRGIF